MNREHIHKFLNALGMHNLEDGEDWVRSSCPLAPWTHASGKDSHPSFGVKVLPGQESHFHCWTCENGSLQDLVYRLRELSGGAKRFNYKLALQLADAELSGDLVLDFSEQGRHNEPDTVFPEVWYKQNFTPAIKVPVAYEYLRKRGVPDKVIRELEITYSQSRNAVVFPIRNRDGDIAQVRARYIDPGDGPRYHVYKSSQKKFTRRIWHGESWYNPEYPVVMVESVFDLASVYRVYQNVLAPLSTGISRELAGRVNDVFEIVTLFDNGTGGDKAREKVDQFFPDAIIQHLYPPDDRGDPGDMNSTEVFNTLEGSLQLEH